MRGIKRPKSLVVLVVITSLLALVACGGKPATTNPTQTTTSPPVTTTTVPPTTTTFPPTSVTTLPPTTTPPVTTTTAPPTSTTTVPPTTSKTRGPNEVWVQGYTFIPDVITVSAGTRVVWMNFDGIDHTVTSDANLFNGVLSANGGTWDFVFREPGTYTYYCAPHPFMLGKVIVQ